MCFSIRHVTTTLACKAKILMTFRFAYISGDSPASVLAKFDRNEHDVSSSRILLSYTS